MESMTIGTWEPHPHQVDFSVMVASVEFSSLCLAALTTGTADCLLAHDDFALFVDVGDVIVTIMSKKRF